MLFRALPVAPDCNNVSENEEISGNRYKSFWGGVRGGCFCKNILPEHSSFLSSRSRSRSVARFAAGELVHGYREDDHHADHN
jgi:hypothetical protein